MSYAPAYAHDIFVSYARANNRPAFHDDPGTRWVSALVRNLVGRLPGAFASSEEPKVFFDETDVKENLPLGDQLEGEIRRSAVLLVVCSRASAASGWCRREWEAFSGPVRAAVHEGRVFVVQIDDVAREDWQGPFVSDLLPFDFRGPPDTEGRRRLLGYPSAGKDQPGSFEYANAVLNLAEKIAAKLRELRDASTAPTVSERPRVYVAEGTPDLDEIREPLRTFLDQSGFDMVPRRAYPRSPTEFKAALERDLKGALAFLQLNGRYVTPRTLDLPTGYEGLQLECAIARGLPVFRWRSRDLILSTIADAEHRRACESEMHWVGNVSELHETLLDALKGLRAREVFRIPEGPRERAFVGIVAPDSEPRAEELSRVLARASVDNEIVPEPRPLTELDDDAASQFDGLLLVLDRAEDTWVRKRSHEFRTLLLRLEKNPRRQPPVFGFYRYVPPRRMPVLIPEFQVVDGGPDGDLNPFIERVFARRRKAVSA